MTKNYDYLITDTDLSLIKDYKEWILFTHDLAKSISPEKPYTSIIFRGNFLSEKIIAQLREREAVLYDEHIKQLEFLKLNELHEIDGIRYHILKKFPIMYSGWECDADGWIAENCNNGERVIIMTNHGQKYIADVSELHAHIAEYREAINDTNAALAMLSSVKDVKSS